MFHKLKVRKLYIYILTLDVLTIWTPPCGCLNKFIAILDPPMSSSNGRKYIFDKAQIEKSQKSFAISTNSKRRKYS